MISFLLFGEYCIVLSIIQYYFLIRLKKGQGEMRWDERMIILMPTLQWYCGTVDLNIGRRISNNTLHLKMSKNIGILSTKYMYLYV